MLKLSSNYTYFLCEGSVDLRKGMYRLADLVYQTMHQNPQSGDVFIFLSKNRKTIKLLHYDRNGYVLYVKKLDEGQFLKPVFDKKSATYCLDWRKFFLLMESATIRSLKI